MCPSGCAEPVPEAKRPGVLLIKGNYGLAGGPETLIASMAQHLDQTRFRPALVVLRRDGVPESPQMDAGRLAIPRTDLSWPGLAGAGLAAIRLRKFAATHGTQLIHTHDMRANLVAWLLAARRRMPWIAHVHGWLGATQTGKWRLYEQLDRRLVKRADLVLVGSDTAKQEVEAAGARRVAILPNAIEIVPDGSWIGAAADVRGRLGIRDGTVVAGILGRVHPGKGHRFLLQGIAKARSQGTDVRGLVVGGGPDLENLRTLAIELGINDAMHFAGFCPDATPYVAAMDVFCAPSLKESLPLTILEAMALRRPVIATRVGDIPAVIQDGYNGLLIEPGDADPIAEALRILAGDSGRRALMGERGRALVEEQFSAYTMCRRLEEFYSSVLERKAEPV